MKEVISGNGKQYVFIGTVQELRDLIDERKNIIKR
jgi:hypothetical protein